MKAHRTDWLSLTFGLIFAAVVAWWLLAQLYDLNLPRIGWLLAGAMILIGLLGLSASLRTMRGKGRKPPLPPA